jgi:hypothetical protein
MEGGREEQIIDAGGEEAGSSFYSQSFKAQLAANQLRTGFDTKDCELNPAVMQLQQLLHQEKSSPDLLPYQTLLIGKLT